MIEVIAPPGPVKVEPHDIASNEFEPFGGEFDGAVELLRRQDRFRRRASFLLPVSIVGLASLAALINPLLSWLIVLVSIAVTIFIVTPVRPLLLVTFFFALAVDNPRSIPASGNWSAPWIFIGGALFKNLDPLPVSLLDIVAGACLIRGLFHFRTESRTRIDRERVFGRLIAISVSALLIAFFWGMVRSGDLKQAIYQMRPMLEMPSFAIAIATVGDLHFLRKLKKVVLLAAGCKALTGLYPYVFLKSNPAYEFEYVTIHADSVLYVMAFAAVVAAWLSGVDKRLKRFHGTALTLTLVGLYTNERRIAFVSMALALLVMYLDAPIPRKRQINKFASRYIPMFVLYLVVAFTGVSRNAIFRPALSLRSVVIQDDRSSSTRDIENFNLFATYRPNPLLGVGFGHEYNEVVAADYIGDVFPQYRFLPHNSFLGLWAFGGMVGAMGFLSLFPTSLYLALVAAKRTHSPEVWSFAMIGAAGIAATLVQAFGDVGFHDPSIGLLGGIAIGICGALYCANDPKKRPVEATHSDARVAVKL